MHKSLWLWAALAGCLGAAELPLEWNPRYNTAVPYEVEIDRGKLRELAGIDPESGFAVFAAGKKLPVTILPGGAKESVLLRFRVPAGTDRLTCTAGTGTLTLAASETTDNLFAGILEPKQWQVTKGMTAQARDGGLYFEISAWGSHQASRDIALPGGVAGQPVKLEIDLQSLAKMTWGGVIRIEQLDAGGKVLPGSATDPRWISQMRPPRVETRYRENGRIHPEAKKLRVVFTFRAVNSPMDNFGIPLKNHDDVKPKLLVSRLTLRPAETLPFPKYNNDLFAPGVSGKPGDFAVNLNGGKIFFYATTPQAAWAEAQQIRSTAESFYPPADGTVEGWFKPDWSASKGKTITLLDAYNMLSGSYTTGRRTLLELSYAPGEKELALYLKDYKDKEFKKSIRAEMPTGKWSHAAIQWSKAGGVQLFLNGQKLIDAPAWSYEGIELAAEETPNSRIPMQFTVGNATPQARGKAIVSSYAGAVDLIRVSSVARYKAPFTPFKSCAVDADTRALFEFDRSFDGKSGGGMRFISGSLRAHEGRVAQQLEVDGKTIQWIPPQIEDDNHPDKVLNALNYPVLPKPEDFHAARRTKRESFRVKNGDTVALECDAPPRMDYVEIANRSESRPLRLPLLLNAGEIDPRSFGDIAASLKLAELPERERIYRIFNFLLGASDYFMSYQADFTPGSDVPNSVLYQALAMLNGYCGFECGPLNNLAATLFSCAGLCPATQTNGYGHAFEQVFYDGKNHLYDLSAQKFFPSFDNADAASLAELEQEPGIFDRVKSAPNHFIRLSTREYTVNQPLYLPKVGMELNPGEVFRVYFANNGMMNDLQYHQRLLRAVCEKTDVSELVHASGDKLPVFRIGRFFPHYANAFLFYNGAPGKGGGAFTQIAPESFCYRVATGYPIVYGEYSATGTDGKPIPMELSTDRGKTFRRLAADPDGVYRLDYPVRARRELLLRFRSPLEKVKQLTAATEMMLNPRILTGVLRPGKNELTFKAENDAEAEVTLQYRTNTRPMVISGGVYHGAIPGFERQLALAEPGKTLTLAVTGAEAGTRVRTFGGLEAKLADGKLTITPEKGDVPRFGAVELDDNGAKKQLTVLVAAGARLATAKDARPFKDAEIAEADSDRVQDCLLFKELNSEGSFRFTRIPAGRYVVWNLNRFPSHLPGAQRRLELVLPRGGTMNVGGAINTGSDYYKAQYGQPGERSRFKWDFPYRKGLVYPHHRPGAVELPETDHLQFRLSAPDLGGVELAAVLLLPEPTEEFTNQMLKILCGLNCEPWSIELDALRRKK